MQRGDIRRIAHEKAQAAREADVEHAVVPFSYYVQVASEGDSILNFMAPTTGVITNIALDVSSASADAEAHVKTQHNGTTTFWGIPVKAGSHPIPGKIECPVGMKISLIVTKGQANDIYVSFVFVRQ